ncbi:hypothetical protein K5X77_10100 (plasmid) [Vagococcus lutrae]|uniref:hypothetical protein n=1 Tax=Vagococcus lutrae TaxID=81947 RepID=UPI001C97C38D|nr:hypothetical protein [Vagococcus lutrae]QZN89763.1 hypothetical protein K5X77_10100 [Vagococcus lutrae]
MFFARRIIFIFIIWVIGVLSGQIGKEIIMIIGVPMLITLIMTIDDKKHQQIKNNA